MKRFLLAFFFLISTQVMIASAAGDLDTTFDTTGYLTDTNGVDSNGVAIQSDGKIVAVGKVGSYPYNPYIARYTASGALDTTFNTTGYIIDTNAAGEAYGVAIQSDGKIVIVGGNFTGLYIARYTTSGALDTTFNTTGYVIDSSSDEGRGVVIQSDGKIVVVGNGGGSGSVLVARYTTSGALDSTFNGTGYFKDTNGKIAYNVALQSDGKLVIVGKSGYFNLYVARYTTAGVLDTTFNTTGYIISTAAYGDNGAGIGIQSDDKIVIGARSTTNKAYIARYTTAGVLDTTFNGTGVLIDTNGVQLRGIVIQSDDKIIGTGYVTSSTRVYTARYTTEGVLDTTFNTTGYVIDANGAEARAVTLQSDNKIVVVGDDSSPSGIYVARYFGVAPPAQEPILTRVYGDAYVSGVAKNPGAGTPGALDLTFGTDGGRNLNSVFGDNTQAQAIRILANGTSIIAAEDPDNNQVKVARFDGDGYVDTTFGTSGVTVIAQQNAMDLYIDAQGRIVVVGAGDSGSWIARLSSAGVLDTTTFGGVGSDPAGIAVGDTDIGFFGVGEQQSGRLIAVGQDTTNGGVVYAFRADGVVDQSFGITTPFRDHDPVSYGSRGSFKITDAVAIYSVAIDPTTDKLYVGYVDSSNNATVAKILADGDDYDINFGPSGANAGAIAAADRIPNIASESPVHAVIDDSGKIILAAVNTSNQYVVRRYLANGSVDTSFNGTGAALTIAATNKAILTHLMMTQAEQAILIGYDDNADNNMMMIRLNSNGTLDTAFSATGVLPYKLDAGNTIRQSRFAAIHPTGKILTVGYEQDLTSSDDDPVIVSVYGDSFVPEYKQAPSASPAGECYIYSMIMIPYFE